MLLKRFAIGVARGLCLALLVAGCAKAQAKGNPDGPPLEVPAPPARVLAPVDEPIPAATAVPDTPAPATPTPPQRPPARRAATPPTSESEPRPEPSQPGAPAAAAPSTAEPPRELRAAPSAADAAAEKAVRDALARAARDLNRVDYGRLSADGRAQYEQSKRFTQQAEQALKDRNFVFAATLADKAAALAVQLAGR